ncbi:Hypothetical predicted protein [Paramuricea clavata]|uniref:Uncharacterized protein n=1 Tax=Paramuricea clavata TaxID=317549 RepID=A0A7D9K409_PARCT|nr:Hypothetical predicted protein [Paramuricea clavata]
MWSPITIFCRRICLLPPTPPHSRLLSKDCHKGKPFMPGESCKYRCKPGYRPSGLYTRELYRKGDFVQRCLKGGTWTNKRCVLLTCPVHDPKIFRWYNCTLGSTFGSVCRLACPGEKVREVRCGAEGKWDKKLQFCSTKGSCPQPNLNEGILSKGCGKHPRPRDECEITCGTRLMAPVVQGDSLKREVKAIVCSPFLQWYPDLSAIRCIAKCQPDLFQDEYCDGINNNEECQFDGGDCCDPDSSCSGNDCECRDVTSPNYGPIASSGDDDRNSS